MNLEKSLRKIIVSNTRLSLFKLFFGKPTESFYIREAVRKTGEEINSVRRELENLREADILKKERRGNSLFYFPDTAHPLYQDFLTIVARVEGLGAEIIENRSRLGTLKFLIYSGHFLRWEDKSSEVDFLLVGKIVLPEVGKLVVKEEEKRGREINYAVMDVKELKVRKKSRDPFLLNVLTGNSAIIYGDPAELGDL